MSDHRIPAVDRALQLLDLLCSGAEPASIRDLSAQLAVPRSTVYRILNSLEAHGVARRDAAGCYAPGPRLLAYARAVPQGADLTTLAAPILATLAAEARATAKLSVLEDESALVVGVAAGPGVYSVTTQIGRRFPLHAGAASKVLAAHLPEAALRKLLRGKLARATVQTITDPKRLAAVFATARREGLATDEAEFIDGVHAVAAPAFGPGGDCVAALSVAYLPTEPPTRRAEMAQAVRAAARRLTVALGGG
jgi:DNA-binding IclR family transcriptional regulator